MSQVVEASGSGSRRLRRGKAAGVDHPAVLEFESPTRALIALPAPFSARIVALLVSLLVLSTTVVCGIVPIDVVVTAEGRLEAKGGGLLVQPLDPAIVRSIEVHPGEMVKAGQVLARLDPTLAGADLVAMRNSVDSLQAEVDRLSAELAGKPYTVTRPDDPAQQLQANMFAQRAAQYKALIDSANAKVNSLEQQIAGNLASANYYRQRLAVAQEVETMRKELQRLQVGSRLNTDAAVDNRIDMMRSLAGAEASAASEKRDLAGAVADRDQIQQKWLADTSQTMTDEGRKLSDAREQLKKANLHNQLVELRAPEDGIVQSIANVSVGSVLQSGDQFITLVPADAPLRASVFVQGQDSGWPAVGDEATIKLTAFPFTLYGVARGTVQMISPDSFTQQNANNPVGGQGRSDARIQQDFSPIVAYRAMVSLDDVGYHGMPPGFHLMPGMPVSVDIKVGHRTVLNYMMGRIMPVFYEGMRTQ